MLTTLRFISLGLVAVVVLLLSLGVFMVFKLWPTGGDVPLLRTPGWEGKHIDELKRGRLTLRRETFEGGALLLKRVDLEPVYRYDLQARSLDAVTDKEWLNAGGPISACSGLGSTPPPVPVRLDDSSNKLVIGDREVSTTGKVPLDYLVSPSGKWVAVLSADGPVISMLFSGRVLGQRYHQLVAVNDAVSTGSSIRIPVMNTLGTLLPCWSVDEKLVIYTDANFSSLVVVETASLHPNQ
jgi:hypothetical protein